MKSPERLYGLDILRAIAILGVFSVHFVTNSYQTSHVGWNGNFPDFSTVPYSSYIFFYPLVAGEYGVTLFFVISGYCIQTSISRFNGSLNISEFYWKRFWRIYPPFLVSLVAFCLLGDYSLVQILAHIAFVFNLHSSTLWTINANYWSLPIEFQLYLIFPIFHFLLHRLSWWKTFLIVLIVTISFHHLYREPSGAAFGGFLPQQLPFAYWAFWCSGAWLAHAHLRKGKIFQYHGVVLALLFPIILGSIYWLPLLKLRWWIGSLFFIVLCDWAVFFRWQEWRKITFPLYIIGLCSYSLYLWHGPALEFVVRLVSQTLTNLEVSYSPPFMMVFGFLPTLTILVFFSYMYYQLFELPSVTLGKKILNRYKNRPPLDAIPTKPI